MAERFKSTPNFNQSQLGVVQTDEETIIKSVVIVQEGVDKVGETINKEFLTELIKQGNSTSLGIKSRFGHPNMCKTTLGTYIGRYKNFSIIEDEGKSKVLADLHLDEITKKVQVEGKGISMHEYITHMAKSNPDMFGNSIHFSGKQKSIKKDFGQEDSESKPRILELKKFFASDLVDTPAATDNLFKSSNDFGVVVTQFLDENPEIFKTVQDNPKVLDDFINRYTNYTKQKNNDMGLIDTIKKKLGTTKNVDLTLADGEMITVITEAETPAVEDRVTDSEGNPIADGEHLLPDGSSIVTASSVITEIKDAPSEEEEESTEETLSAEEVTTLKSFIKSIPAFTKSMKIIEEVPEALEIITDTQKSMDDKFKTLAKSVGTEFEPKEDSTVEEGRKKLGNEPKKRYKSYTKQNKETKA